MHKTSDVWLMSVAALMCWAAYVSTFHSEIDFVSDHFSGHYQR